MPLKGYLQSTYQNVLNLDDVNFSDLKNKKNDVPFVKLKVFASNIQLINRLNKEGKITEEKAKYYIENQKNKIIESLIKKKNFKNHDIEKFVGLTISKITDL